MIHEVQGNLLHEKTGLIIHGCNAQGVFNKGIAKQIRSLYPECYNQYIKNFDFVKELYPNCFDDVLLGTIGIIEINKDLVFVNAITQKYFGNDKNVVYVNYDAIAKVFNKIVKLNDHYNLTIKFPKIGAGLANGDWDKISKIINNELQTFNGVAFYL